MKNRTAFRIKTGHYPELLKPEAMKIPGSTKSKIIKDKNSGNVPHLEVTEVVLVDCKQ